MPTPSSTLATHAPHDCYGVHPEVLLRTHRSWDGTPYQGYPDGRIELTLQRIRLEPNTAVNWHQHPCPVIVYVMSGELRLQLRDSDRHCCFGAGSVIAEVVDLVHRGTTGDLPVELLMFCAGAQGMAVAIEADGPTQ